MRVHKGFRAMSAEKANTIHSLGGKAAALKRRFTLEKFWQRIKILEPNACWEWQGFRDKRGYGHARFGRKTETAYRIAYVLSTGRDPGELHVCHKCDNPPCCNPAHLFLGTARENCLDRTIKGRTTQCEDHPFAKITSEIADLIRKEYRPFDRNSGSRALARKYNISPAVVSGIVNGKRWKKSLVSTTVPIEEAELVE